MRSNVLFIALLPMMTVFTCASVRAQSGFDFAQTSSSSHGQVHNAQSAPEPLISPLLGAPQDYEDVDLSHAGAANTTNAAGTARQSASLGGSQKHSAQPKTRSSLIPLLGAPQDYEDTDLSGAGDEPGGQATAHEVVSYRITPTEKMVSPAFADRRMPAEGTTTHGVKDKTAVVGNPHEPDTFGPHAAASNLSTASQLHFSSRPIGADNATPIYKSPW